MMASHRIGARVAGLSPAQLCAIIEAQAGASDAALRVADEHATRLVEQPEWVLSEVLLSPDLAPHILAQLPTTAHAAKGTAPAALPRRVTAADIMCSVVPAGAELRHVELFGTSRRVGALVRLNADLRSDSAAARRCRVFEGCGRDKAG
ncbi:hypothetical protein EMIHUDRAFT_221019 [Emiliania huxleyi CCMP1516]|uniref:Uncharacterized protein n=2 Tax=Emiliania huxleyi TaxID=2903 RepID=A0A0D3HZV0_EMIH1|nr:hypothetical protein EMIHUDRAFT_221019 [Emiliania huxleyi CCMP1516]EOD04535.1 hypothetical protein EMIHUDRAFT_221019 [Emiliania huxleyi CCMP1516]|eukprot:XP_005756964.1 hypothetical protein EMIHUDRAFT_221019 [Emiliania huxleyi CCMP1516]